MYEALMTFSKLLIRIRMSNGVKYICGHIACMREITNAYKILVENPVGKRQLDRHRCRWEDNINVDLK
jgi:hypothetical protein